MENTLFYDKIAVKPFLFEGNRIFLIHKELCAAEFSFGTRLVGLTPETTYYYCSYVKFGNVYVYGEVNRFTTTSPVVPAGYTNLSATGTANGYIVSNGGNYSLLVAIGNQTADTFKEGNAVSTMAQSAPN